MNHYWVKSGQSLAVTCPWCSAPVMEPCLTNKNLPHQLGYVHRAREGSYFNFLKNLVAREELGKKLERV